MTSHRARTTSERNERVTRMRTAATVRRARPAAITPPTPSVSNLPSSRPGRSRRVQPPVAGRFTSRFFHRGGDRFPGSSAVRQLAIRTPSRPMTAGRLTSRAGRHGWSCRRGVGGLGTTPAGFGHVRAGRVLSEAEKREPRRDEVDQY